MTSTLENLVTVQAERSGALHEKAKDNLFRTLVLDPVQRRNAVLDAVFYNIANLDTDELPDLAFWLAREGALLLVPPSGRGTVKVSLEIDEFLTKGGKDVAALAVAGVGSSAVGAAAFARDIANALDAPVAAVVSGYGLSDVLTEALGGFFWFGGLNSIRHSFEGFDRLTKQFTASEPTLDASSSAELLRLSKDTAVLIGLLERETFKAPLLIGHSKGNLVISEALYALESKGTLKPLAKRCNIITISAKVGMPDLFKGKVFDIIGQLDAFGALNSRPDIPADYVVSGAWHSTNPDFPMGMGMDVTKTLKRILPLLGQASPPPRPGPASFLFDLPQWATGAVAGLSS